MKRPALLSLLCLLVACGSVRAPVPDPGRADRDPLDVVRAGGDAVSSLRATFVAHVRREDQAEHARGVLLVSKPQRFRLRLSSLLGFTILDYISDSGDDRLWLASTGRLLVGDEISRAGLFSGDSVRWIFLRHHDLFGRGCRQLESRAETLVECRDDSGGVLYRGHVDNGSHLLSRETVFDQGAAYLTIRYRDYRVTDGVRLPYRIEWDEETTGARVEIEISRYEVDPILPAELFAPLRP